MFGGLHAEKCVEQILAVADHAVIVHQDGFVALDERLERYSEFAGAGSAVASDRNATEGEHEFAEDCFVEGNARSGVTSSGERMRVADGIDVRAAAVNQEMHAELRAGVATAAQFAAIQIGDDEIVWRHHAF